MTKRYWSLLQPMPAPALERVVREAEDAVAGTPDEARARIDELWQYADSITLVPPNNFLKGDRIAEYRSAIAETFPAR